MTYEINNSKISSAVIFLEKYATDEYNIEQNRIIYNRNLRLPDVKEISTMDLSAIEVKGLVMVSCTEKLDFEKLPKAELYWGLGLDKLYFNPKSKIARKDLEQKGFPKKVGREYGRQQVLKFFSNMLGLGQQN